MALPRFTLTRQKPAPISISPVVPGSQPLSIDEKALALLSTGAMPSLVMARLGEGGHLLLLRVRKTFYQPREVRSKQNGNPTAKTTAVYEPTTIEQTRYVSRQGVRVLGADGKEIDPQRLPKLLAKERPVLMVCEGQIIDPLLWRLLKEDTLTLVLPSAEK